MSNDVLCFTKTQLQHQYYLNGTEQYFEKVFFRKSSFGNTLLKLLACTS